MKKIKIIGAVFVVMLIFGFFVWPNTIGRAKKPQYQTAEVTKGTIVKSLSESGTVASTNRVSVTTAASGVDSFVFVKNGDIVSSGDKIAVLDLDQNGLQKQAQTLSGYLSAKTALDNANTALYTLQSTMLTKWNTFYNLAGNSTYQNSDGTPNNSNRALVTFATAQDDWLAAEASYKNQQNVIAQSQASLNNAWLSYQAAMATILAPTAGVVSDLILAPGMPIANTVEGSQFIASIKNSGNPIININLSEIDAVIVKANDKATLTFDALQDKTFSGKVIGINTTGVVTSGVTTYPATIRLDVPNDSLLPNMSATANIIVDVRDNVLTVPTSAIQTLNNESVVRVLKNNQITSVPVEKGISSDFETEIISGVSQGETIITGVMSTAGQSSGTSPFGGGLRIGGGSGGAVFMRGGGR